MRGLGIVINKIINKIIKKYFFQNNLNFKNQSKLPPPRIDIMCQSSKNANTTFKNKKNNKMTFLSKKSTT